MECSLPETERWNARKKRAVSTVKAEQFLGRWGIESGILLTTDLADKANFRAELGACSWSS